VEDSTKSANSGAVRMIPRSSSVKSGFRESGKCDDARGYGQDHLGCLLRSPSPIVRFLRPVLSHGRLRSLLPQVFHVIFVREAQLPPGQRLHLSLHPSRVFELLCCTGRVPVERG